MIESQFLPYALAMEVAGIDVELRPPPMALVDHEGDSGSVALFERLGRGASVMMQSADVLPMMVEQSERRQYGVDDGTYRRGGQAAEHREESHKAKEEEREEAEEDEYGSQGKAKEERGEHQEGDEAKSDEDTRAEQMRQDEQFARQLQIQFLREEVGGDEGTSGMLEYLHQF